MLRTGQVCPGLNGAVLRCRSSAPRCYGTPSRSFMQMHVVAPPVPSRPPLRPLGQMSLNCLACPFFHMNPFHFYAGSCSQMTSHTVSSISYLVLPLVQNHLVTDTWLTFNQAACGVAFNKAFGAGFAAAGFAAAWL